jgi:hypothetical protein
MFAMSRFFCFHRASHGAMAHAAVFAALSLSLFASPAAHSQTVIPAANRITASDGAALDNLGISASISGNRALVGAYQATINSNFGAGAAYIFDATTGAQIQKLVANDGTILDNFGYAVSLSGNTALVGAAADAVNGNSNQGSAYLFNATTGAQTQKLVSNDGTVSDFFGISVAVSGNTALVGASLTDTLTNNNQGSVYVFNATTGAQTQKLIANDGVSNAEFGRSVSISGNFALIGAHQDTISGNFGQGSAYLFDTATGTQIRKLMASDGAANDKFGYSVSLSGNLALVGAYDADINGNLTQGAAYLFDVTTGLQLFKFTALDGAAFDSFGYSVALSGNLALIGAYTADINGNGNQGAVYAFDATTGQQIAKYVAGDGAASDLFGSSVALDGTTALTGAYQDAVSGKNSQGSAYRFTAPTVTASATAPEPSSLALLGLTALPLLSTLRRRHIRKA